MLDDKALEMKAAGETVTLLGKLEKVKTAVEKARPLEVLRPVMLVNATANMGAAEQFGVVQQLARDWASHPHEEDPEAKKPKASAAESAGRRGEQEAGPWCWEEKPDGSCKYGSRCKYKHKKQAPVATMATPKAKSKAKSKKAKKAPKEPEPEPEPEDDSSEEEAVSLFTSLYRGALASLISTLTLILTLLHTTLMSGCVCDAVRVLVEVPLWGVGVVLRLLGWWGWWPIAGQHRGEGRGAQAGLGAIPLPKPRPKVCMSHGADEVVDDDIILDLGATHDVIGGAHEDRCDKVALDDPVPMDTAAHRVWITVVGSMVVSGMLGFSEALVAPWSGMTLLSLPTRLRQGWQWLGSGQKVTLLDPEGTEHRFCLKDRFFRYAGSGGTVTSPKKARHRCRVRGKVYCSVPRVYQGCKAGLPKGSWVSRLLMVLLIASVTVTPGLEEGGVQEILKDLHLQVEGAGFPLKPYLKLRKPRSRKEKQVYDKLTCALQMGPPPP